MENQPPNDGGQSRIPPAKSSNRKSDEKHRKEKASAGSFDETSEDETPMFQALEEQPAATATKNGVSQPAGYTSSFAKDLVRSSKNGHPSIKPNPKFLKKKEQIPAPKTGKTQKSKTPEKATEAEAVKKPESQKKPKKSEKEQIDQLIELIEDQHADNQKIGDRVEQMGQATVNHLNELYTFIKNETKILKDDNKVLKDDNKVLKDKIKALEDKAKKAEAFNNEALMGKITEVGTAVGDLARSDTPIEETTSVKKTIRELAEEVKRSNRSVAECARIGEKFDNFLRDNQSPRARRDSKRQRRDKHHSPICSRLMRRRLIL